MRRKFNYMLGFAVALLASQAFGQVTFYEGEEFHGRAFTTNRQVGDFQQIGFNDRASSVVVSRGSWEVCEDVRFNGRCVVLRQGSYDSLRELGMENRISSVRRADDRRRYDNEIVAPHAAPAYEYRRRPDERVFEARVTSVHAVVGPPEQRCWVERQQVDEPRSERSVGGAIVGAIIGGVLGHQVGRGSGKDIATAGGAVAGAAIGSNVGRSGGSYDSDVRRCETTASGPLEYWDVSYNFRGVEHRLQMSSAPGRTIFVNQDGEPRQ
ncbi:beta/gamma crystallin-related protein [Uliginosibacterium gangwonense]|uniref:beta/gamma crystallin-related protein n=1 Tax=Uliginosibacterium gangwonense TaxID=392736 RepID=UPI0003A2E26C|nr:beta/gamma crystallin-related protein [Uliginosibacterium gangwonense]